MATLGKCDFSFRHYREILQIALENGYRFIDWNANPSGRTCILRHDVDYLPESTLHFARIEKELGIRSTYFFQIGARTYNLREPKVVKAIDEIKKLNHQVGLHFDFMSEPDTAWENIPQLCLAHKKIFEVITGHVPCEIVSFHNPHKFRELVLNKNILGMAQTYAPRYFSEIKYLSDSQRWLESCACEIFSTGKYPNIQLLIHADYWSQVSSPDMVKNIAHMVNDRADDYLQNLFQDHPLAKEHQDQIYDELRSISYVSPK